MPWRSKTLSIPAWETLTQALATSWEASVAPSHTDSGRPCLNQARFRGVSPRMRVYRVVHCMGGGGGRDVIGFGDSFRVEWCMIFLRMICAGGELGILVLLDLATFWSRCSIGC